MIGDVNCVRFRRALSCGVYLGAYFLRVFLRPAHTRHVRAFACQPHRDCMANSPPRACNNCDLIFKSHRHMLQRSVCLCQRIRLHQRLALIAVPVMQSLPIPILLAFEQGVL
jgi:hypothetical protein